MRNELRVVERLPSVEDYQRLRRSVGWSEVSDEAAATGLARSLASFCLVNAAEQILGIGRVVGDAGVYFYVQDVIVDERARGRGHGGALMAALLAYVERAAVPGAFVGLMAARGVSGFYERYGFERRPDDGPGMAMTWR